MFIFIGGLWHCQTTFPQSMSNTGDLNLHFWFTTCLCKNKRLTNYEFHV